MVTHREYAYEFPYAFFPKIFAYKDVNFANEHMVEMGDYVISLKMCNNKM